MTAKNGNGGTTWRSIQVVFGTIAALATSVGGLYYLVSLTLEQRHNAEQIATQRTEINLLHAQAAEMRSTVGVLQRDLNEIETQFCAADDLRNQIHATDVRNYAVLFEKVFGQPYPTADVYYARVCNRRPVGGN